MAITPQPGVGSPSDVWTFCFRLQESSETAKIQAHLDRQHRGCTSVSCAQTQKQALDHSFWIITLWLVFIQHLPQCEHQGWKSPWFPSLSLGTDMCQHYHQQRRQQLPGARGEGGAAHTVAKAGRNCLDDGKGGIAQLTQKRNRLPRLSSLQGVSQRLCVPCSNTLYLIQCNQHEVPIMRVWGWFCLVFCFVLFVQLIGDFFGSLLLFLVFWLFGWWFGVFLGFFGVMFLGPEGFQGFLVLVWWILLPQAGYK